MKTSRPRTSLVAARTAVRMSVSTPDSDRDRLGALLEIGSSIFPTVPLGPTGVRYDRQGRCCGTRSRPAPWKR